MKKLFPLLLLLLMISINALAQPAPLSTNFKKESIASLSKLINDHYVEPDVALQTTAHLQQQLTDGYFDAFTTLETFAKAVTEVVQSINKDKHMLIRPAPLVAAKEYSVATILERHRSRLAYLHQNTGGFHAVQKLEGNVGYLDIRNFPPPHIGRSFADSFMSLLASSDAIIVDLRKNDGGHPGMVQYLCSYFFDQKVHLNSLYFRQGNHTEEYWTLAEINGTKMPDVPLFVLTSDYTFSGAEEFSYNMKTQKRATLIGETTRGGANPGRGMPINPQLEVFIPTGKAINPITKTNWEGVGVIPDIKIESEKAFDEAYRLAKVASETYRKKRETTQEALSTALTNSIRDFDVKTGAAKLMASLQDCTAAQFIGEGEINLLGYDHLLKFQKPQVAEALFKANTEFFPQSANVYDSYAECLVANGKIDAAIQNYEKAVQQAKKNKDPNLALFQENLKRTKALRQ